METINKDAGKDEDTAPEDDRRDDPGGDGGRR
jgi:hypothetical protein